MMHEVKIDYSKCVYCKTCITVCPMGVYSDDGEKVKVSNVNECVACMSCVPACPMDAITVKENI